ncbi:lysoplasmalogenase family protein [Isoptericola sp. NPDC057191]|uniref:lysoplasmalogenase family protein n=1 Tax=Isoptericola sp. NPDC057191 TaxID=3346041 RepID=UPI0036400831
MTDVVHPGLLPAPPQRLLPTACSRAAAVALTMITVLHLVAQLGEASAWARATQGCLMPLLGATLWCAAPAPRSRLVRLVLVALGLSWLGDTVPAAFTGDTAFLAMVGCFLLAQVAYVVAFWPARGTSVARRPVLLLPYAVAAAVLVGVCAAGAGPLLAAVVVYGVCLVATAVLATGVHPLAGVGGAVFLVSDAMIALGAFTDWFAPPSPGFWVMLTYVAGQALIVAGVLARSSSQVSGSGTGANPSRS